MKNPSLAGNTSQFLSDVFPQISFFTTRQKSSIQANLKFNPMLTANPTENFALNFHLEQSTRNMLLNFSKLSSGIGHFFCTIFYLEINKMRLRSRILCPGSWKCDVGRRGNKKYNQKYLSSKIKKNE